MLLDSSESKAGPADNSVGTRVPSAITDTGRERELNEDRYAVIECDAGTVWIVCDGMGGASGGELAAQLAIDAIRRELESYPGRSGEEALRAAIFEANRVIVLRRQNQAFQAMGTTIVSAMFSGRELILAHVGDSRAYLLRDSLIQQLTTDHTYVQELVERGQIRSDEALSHPQAHVLTRAIGAEPALDLMVQRFWIWPTVSENRSKLGSGEVTKGDFVLLCSDGLYSMVSDEEIAQITFSEPPQRACAQLVELANSRGGFDNITVVLLPLPGQLRNEPPPGFDMKRAQRLRKQTREPEEADIFGLLRFVFLVVILAILSVLLVVFLMAFRLGSAG